MALEIRSQMRKQETGRKIRSKRCFITSSPYISSEKCGPFSLQPPAGEAPDTDV